MKKKLAHGSVVIDGKEIPFTKEGLPNLLFLSKEGKNIVRKFKEDKKKQKKEVVASELIRVLKSL